MRRKSFKTTALGFVVGLINGLFGSGGGIILVPFMQRCLDVEEHKSHATTIAVILPLSIISSIIYLNHDVINYGILIGVVIGGLVGGFIGAKVLSKIKARWLHFIFGIFMIIAAVRMIF